MTRDHDLPDEHDDRLEALLRDALREEAAAVVPSGEGLSKIQQTVRARRARRRWLQPAVALGSAAALVLVALGAYAVVSNHNGNQKVIVGHDGTSPSPQPSSPSPSTAPVDQAAFPDNAIFPFTSAAEEKNWEKDYAAGSSPWETQPKAVALSWVDNVLGLSSIDKVIAAQQDGTEAGSVTLGRVIGGESSKPVEVTVVHLAKYGNAWIVTGASDPNGSLTLTSPDPGAAISSPVTVTGPGFGVDESMQVDVRDAESPTSYGTGRTGFGNGTKQWQVSVDYTTPTSPVGTLLAVVDSAADGGPQRVAAQQVQFATAKPGTSTPAYLYAVKDQRVAQFASSDGSFVGYLTDQQPGGGPSDPQLADDGAVVYYLQGEGTCANSLMQVTVHGHSTNSVAAPDEGYVIKGYAVLRGSDAGHGYSGLAVYETACGSQTSPQAKLKMQTADPSGPGAVSQTVDFPSQPPAVMGDPVWEADGLHVDAFVRTGNSGYLARYDATSADSPMPNSNACPAYDVTNAEPAALDFAGGELWIADRAGSGMEVVKCGADGHLHSMFTVPGNDQPADLSVTSDGQAALLTDISGGVWRWEAGSAPKQLQPSVPVTQLTW